MASTLGEVDPLLVSVPVLLAVAAAVLALRAYPWPLLLVSRLAARTRGSVAFLGTARAGRAAVAAPLVVVVLAIGTAAFCAVVAAGVDASRERAAVQIVPADAVIRGERFAPDTIDELGRLPGVRAVTRVLFEDDERLAADELGTDAASGRRTCCWSTARGWTRWPANPRWTCRFRPRCSPPGPARGRCRRSSHRRSPPTWRRPG